MNIKILHKKKKPPQRRVISRNNKEKLEIEVVGKHQKRFDDMYARLLDSSWWNLAGTIVTIYCLINIVFAGLYLAIGDGIENARPGSFMDAFFFSVQTMATIGYGRLIPIGALANTLVTVEALSGFCFLAVVTGLIFAKFSLPTARIIFSNVAVITNFNGTPHLMVRLANQRGNRIVEAQAHLSLLKLEVSKEGYKMRRFYDMKLMRDRLPLLQLSWTLMHPIDADSPLLHVDKEKLEQEETEIIIAINGLDETLSQTIHARFSYLADEIVYGEMFEDVVDRNEDHRIRINYEQFHKTRKA